MLSRLIIENFKAIRERVELEVRPITLLFGPNSSGKSSVFHAIQFLRQSLELPADLSALNSGPLLDEAGIADLGGFSKLVHGHDQGRTMVLGADFRVNSVNIGLPHGMSTRRPEFREKIQTVKDLGPPAKM
jgi:hypothetical protein